MMCTCPKCHAKIELELPEVTEAGTPASCPACNARFTVHRESFGGRALRKTSEISCAVCGSELGSQMHCAACGAQFPDYLVPTLGRRRSRRDTKKVKLKTSPFPQAQKPHSQLPSLEMSMKPEAAKSPAHAPAGARRPKILLVAAGVLVLAAVIAAGSVFFLKIKAEKAYAKSFVLATYCIQTGYDRALKASARISGEWKGKMDQGQPYAARPNLEEERDFGIINNKLDPAVRNLGQAPEKFASCNEKLSKLQAVYNKLRTLVLAPGNSQQAFADSTGKLEADYRQAVKEYKSGLPQEIMEELVSASLKFKGLRPLLR